MQEWGKGVDMSRTVQDSCMSGFYFLVTVGQWVSSL